MASTTIQQLQYVIEANTDMLNKAIPALEKLVNTLETVAKQVDKTAKSFEQQTASIKKSADAAGAAQTSSAQKTAAALAKQKVAVEQARDRVEAMNAAVKKAGGDSLILANNARAFKNLEKSIAAGSAETTRFSQLRAQLESQMIRSQRELDKLTTAEKANQAAIQKTEQLMLKQENALERNRIKYLDLLTALERTKAAPARIQALNAAFQQYEQTMTKTALSGKEFGKAQNQFAAALGNVRRQSNITDPTLEKLGGHMTDLAKSIQVALGPLSGLASRLTAFTSLANRNNIMIAGMVAGLISFGVAMAKAIGIGADYERQLLKIEAVLRVTNYRIGLTVGEIDALAQKIASTTMATQGEVRDAAAVLLTMSNISKDLFENALLAAQGLSLIGEGGIAANIRKIGRLLENPIENLSALNEAGVRFNKAEQEQIKLLQLSNKLREAQNIVMKRVQGLIAAATKETGGLAGEWHRFTTFLTTFNQQAGLAGGAVHELTRIFKTLNDRLIYANDNTEAAIRLGQSYTMVIKTLGDALIWLLDHFKEIAIIIGVLYSARGVVALIKGFQALMAVTITTVKVMALLQTALIGVVATAGSLIAIVTAIAFVLEELIFNAAGLRRTFINLIMGMAAPLIYIGKVLTEMVFGKETANHIFGWWDDIVDYIEQALGRAQKSIEDFGHGVVKWMLPVEPIEARAAALINLIRSIQNQVSRSNMSNKLEDETSARLERLRQQILNMATLKQDVPQEIIEGLKKAFEMISTDAEGAAAVIKTLDDSLQDLATTAGSAIPDATNQAVELFMKMREQFLGDEQAAKDLEAQLYGMKDAWNASTDAVKEQIAATLQMTPEEVTAAYNRMIHVAEQTGTAIRAQTNDLQNQLAIQQLELQATSALGDAKADLLNRIAALQAATKSGLLTNIAMTDVTNMLSDSQRAELATVMALTTALEGLNRKIKQEEQLVGLEDTLLLQQMEIANIGKSEQETTALLAVEKLRLETLREGGDIYSETYKQIKFITAELSKGEIVKSYLNARMELQESIKLMEYEASLSNMNVGLRSEAVAVMEDQLELSRIYNLRNDEGLQMMREMLRLRAEEREAMRGIIHLQNMDELDRQTETINTQLDLLWATNEAREYELAILEARQRLQEQFGELTNPMAVAELQRIQNLKLLEIRLGRLSEFADTVRGGFTDMFDSLVEGFESGELSVKNFGKTVMETMEMVINEIFKLLIVKPLTDALMGLMGQLLGGIAGGSTGGVGHHPTSAGGGFFSWLPFFAKGGIVNSPSIVGMATGGMAVAGEGRRGPVGPEAVLPLVRTRGGRLGVTSEGGGGTEVKITVINNSNAQIRTEEQQGPRGKTIRMFIDDVTSQNLNSASSETSRALRNTYGARPGLIPRG